MKLQIETLTTVNGTVEVLYAKQERYFSDVPSGRVVFVVNNKTQNGYPVYHTVKGVIENAAPDEMTDFWGLELFHDPRFKPVMFNF